jgi:peptidoglycan/LPS O-acetylase OafA/YrhL
MRRFAELEGLRGLLALWVVTSHLLLLSAINPPWPLDRLLHGGTAVFVFMILSGFVITHLRLEKKEGYAPYLVRRFFRLFPVYVVCLAISTVLRGWRKFVVTHAEWSTSQSWLTYRDGMLRRAASETHSFWQHLLAHVTMFQGLLPDQALDQSATTLLGPAWSISLEWQFYLLAPLILLTLLSSRSWMVTVLALLGLYLFIHGYLGSYPIPSTLPAMLGYFLIGMVFRLYLQVPPLSQEERGLSVVSFAILFIVLCLYNSGALMIWSVAFGLILFQGSFPRFRKVFTNRVSLFLGRISYPIYLVHGPVFVLVAFFALRLDPKIDQTEILMVLCLSVIGVIGLAYLVHKAIELPGMRVGSSLADRLGDTRAQSEPATT